MKRIVLKVGSAVLTDQAHARLAKERMMALVELIFDLKKQYEVILVTSAAVAAGYTELKLDKKDVGNRQTLAAIGQPLLMKHYKRKMEKFGMTCAQMLLTADDFDSRKRTEHASVAIETMLKNNVVPVINENDVTATEELLFGDNDQLSSRVAHYFKADMLVFLSDIDGYYNKNPHEHEDAELCAIVHEIAPENLEVKHNPNGHFATGGIVTKLLAANYLLQYGKPTFLTTGFDLQDARSFLIERIHKGGTLFTPAKES